jgi:hypothetical protein
MTRWYAGHYHGNKITENGRFQFLFDNWTIIN